MLFVLTCADLSAVGPGVLNSWKVEILTDLYRRAMRHLAGDIGVDVDQEIEERQQRIQECTLIDADSTTDRDWFQRQIESLPFGIVFSQEPEKIGRVLRRLRTS